MKKLSGISIFFPCLNDAKILPYLIEKSCFIAENIALRYEVIIINDGSTDDTRILLNRLQKRYPRLKVIHHRKNRGYGRALNTGFKAARYDWVFYTDGDGQYNPYELLLLTQFVSADVAVVNGYKRTRYDSIYRQIIGQIYNEVLQRLYKLPISDIDCDFRLIKRSLLHNLQLYSNSGTICLELILKLQAAGAMFREVGVNHYPRLFGRSQFFRPVHLIKTLQEHIRFYQEWRHFPMQERKKVLKWHVNV